MSLLCTYFARVKPDLSEQIPEGFLESLHSMYDFAVLEAEYDFAMIESKMLGNNKTLINQYINQEILKWLAYADPIDITDDWV